MVVAVPARGLVVVGASVLAFASGCQRVECASEIISGAGMMKGTSTGTEETPELRRASVRAACTTLCERNRSGGEEATEAEDTSSCIARCVTDADAMKIGVRTTCRKL